MNPPRTLRRLPQQKKVAGVCAGLARYAGVDPVLVRLAFVLLTVVGGSGLVLYAVAWAIMPKASGNDATELAAVSTAPRSTVLGFVGLAVGAAYLFGSRPFGFFLDGAMPLLLIGGGVALLMQRTEDPGAADRSPPGRASGATSAGGTPGPARAAGVVDDGVAPVAGVATSGPRADGTPIMPPGVSGPYGAPPDPAGPSGDPTQAGAWSGGSVEDSVPNVVTDHAADTVPAWASDWYRAQCEARAELGLPPLPPPEVPGSGATATTARRTRRGCRRSVFGGLAFLAVLGGLALLAGLVVLPGGVGDRNHHPLTWADVDERYELGIGELVVDLRDLPPLAEDRSVSIKAGVGHVAVWIPAHLPIELRGHAGAGQVVPPAGESESSSGLGANLELVDAGVATSTSASSTSRPTGDSVSSTTSNTSAAAPGDPSASPAVPGESTSNRPDGPGETSPRLRIDAEVGAGLIEVRRA